MRTHSWTARVSLVALGCTFAISLHATADDSKVARSKLAKSDAVITAADLARRQKSVELRYKQFEDALQNLVAYYAKNDSAKAELIRQAIGRSQKLRVGQRIAAVIKVLNSGEFDAALDGQDEVVGYAATGTFLSMEYYDFYYHIVAILVLLHVHVKDQLAQPATR